MINTNIIIPARNLQKSYKTIIERVKTKKEAAVLTTNKKPQAAIVSLEDLEKLKQLKTKQANLEMLKLAIDQRNELKGLPADLRKKVDEILYIK